MPSMALDAPATFAAFDPGLYREPPMSLDNFAPMLATTTASMHSPEATFTRQLHQQTSSIDTSPVSQSAAFRDVSNNLQLPFDSTAGEPSLDGQSNSNTQIVRLSGESDPYLLSRHRYDRYNEASFQSIRLRNMTSSSDGLVPAIFSIQHNGLASKAQPPPRSDEVESLRREVDDMVSEDVGRRLIALFYRYVQPYFPVLRRSHGRSDSGGECEPGSTPTCILAAVYGHALPFRTWDEKLCVEVYTPPSADALFRIAWLACLSALHTPSLSVLQTLLLLVQRRPTNKHVCDTPSKWFMMNTAVSIAQALGLNRDPGDWPLPTWERRLRRRLAWAVFVQDKWLALSFGRTSHIQADDWDMRELSEEDFEEVHRGGKDGTTDRSGGKDGSAGYEASQHFIHLCKLTDIVSDILRDLFSLRATRNLHNSLEATLEVAKPLRIHLTEWYQALPPDLLPQTPSSRLTTPATPTSPLLPSPNSQRRQRHGERCELDGTGSLHLAYITAKIELFRAMLRPPATDADAAAVSALRMGVLAVAREVVQFLEGLRERELVACSLKPTQV